MSYAAALAVVLSLGYGPGGHLDDATYMPPIEHWGPPTVPYVIHHAVSPLPWQRHNHVAMTIPWLIGGKCHIWINPALFDVDPLAYAANVWHEWAHCPEADGTPGWRGGEGENGHPGEGTVDVDVEIFFAPWLEAWGVAP